MERLFCQNSFGEGLSMVYHAVDPDYVRVRENLFLQFGGRRAIDVPGNGVEDFRLY